MYAYPFMAQESDSNIVKGLCIAAPDKDQLDRFVTFIDGELATLGINTLVLRVDYNYAFESHPELRDQMPMSGEDVKKIVRVCKKHNINLVPQINLLGHQSWATENENLLEVYPQFDETPNIKLPGEYKWPNDDGLYCKSYCPLHPDLHKIVFALVDEIMEVFEATSFHAGMDEVFYIGEDQCPRCNGHSKAELFAREVTKIRNHLAVKGRTLWIWGDRLLDGNVTGIGMWEASTNGTHTAIDMIPKDIVINDWHYERAEPTAHYFSSKGFQVITCPWNKPEVGISQVKDFYNFRAHANETLAERYLGIMQTYWSSAKGFMDNYESSRGGEDNDKNAAAVQCFKAVLKEITTN